MNETEIFANALKFKQESAREDFLDKECGDDEKMRLRLTKLIAAHLNPNAMSDSPADELEQAGFNSGNTEKADTAAWESNFDELQQIGPYKLLQKIGEGGMGVVYMAEQLEPVKRRVALKIVKPGMDSKRVLARFTGSNCSAM